MTWFWSWLFIAVAAVVVGWGAWRLAGWLMRPPPAPRHPDPEVFLTWPVDKQHAYLRHPMAGPRCACHRYCIHYGPVIGRDETRHDAGCCQPLREVTP